MANCRNTQQLNITCGTDVVLHDKLMFDGEVFDPNVTVDIECSLVNSLGKRTALEYEIADDELVIQIPWVDGRNAGCYGLEVKGKCNGKTWATYADSLIRYTRATVEGATVVEAESDWYDVTQVVSYRYSDSPLDEVDATIDDNYGEPTVTPTYEHNKLTLDFKNLRGNGIVSVEQTVTSTEDEGVNEATITQDNGNTTVMQVRNGRKGTKGDKGDTGDSAIFDPTTGNISEMKQTTGLDELSPMSQKAVTEELSIYDNINLSDTTIVTSLENIAIAASTKKWVVPSVQMTVKLVRVIPDSTIALKPTSVYDTAVLTYTFLTSNAHTANTSPSFATGYDNTINIPAQTLQYITVPSNAVYLYLLVSNNNTTREPSVCAYVKNVKEGISDNKTEISALKGYAFSSNMSLPEVDYSILKGTGKFGTDTTMKHTYLQVNPGEKYAVKAPSSNVAIVCFATSKAAASGGDIPIVSGTEFITVAIDSEAVLTIPDGCAYLLVYNGGNARPFSIKKMMLSESLTIIKPKLSIDFLGGLTGDFSTDNDNCVSGLWCCTPRFIKTSKVHSIKADRACSFRCYYYDSEKNYIDVKLHDLSADTETLITQSSEAYTYVKIAFNQSSGNEFTLVNAELTGVFTEKWDAFNKRPYSGYHGINAIVNVSNPASSNEETQSVQDNPRYLPNYGLIALPTTYKDEGEPTRLIIYCHGAGTHFMRGATAFNTNEHVDPEYFLKEGYAVMDMDGNPFEVSYMQNNVVKYKDAEGNALNSIHYHAFIPQAMDCYVAGYKWAIEHYNLCRDGVFVGGRSMGGGTTLMFAHRQCKIPVIAACPNLPTSLAMNRYATHKGFGAIHRGYILPDGFAWQDGADDQHPYSETEKLVVLANWDKFITNPVTALINDLPTDAQWKIAFLNSCTLNNNDRITMMENLHMVSKCPIKMFGCNQDPNNTPETTARLYKTMLKNSGQIAELRMFNSYKDYTGTGYTAHYYELQDPALRTTVVTKYGEEVSNVPMVYVEMLQFWRRYEQGN